MARPIGIGRPVEPGIASGLPKGLITDPSVAPHDLTFFKGPKGLDTLTPLSKMDREHSPLVLNFRIKQGIMKSRLPIGVVGSLPSPAEPTVLAVDAEQQSQFQDISHVFHPYNLVKIPLRWTKTKLYIRDPLETTDWSDTGIAHKLSNTGVDFTMWRELVVYPTGATNPVNNGLYELTFYPAFSFRLLPNSPCCEHVATFGNRIVASFVYGTGADVGFPSFRRRVQWSVKDNDGDWTGLGSGFEDMLLSTDDTYDDVMGVYPISDTTALVVREASIWRMDVTGFFDAPFQFTLLTDQIGTVARRTIRSIPGGVIFLGYDDVYVFSLEGIKRVGTPALSSVFGSTLFAELGSAGAASTLATSWGFFDHFHRVYWLNIKNLGTFLFSFDDQAWTRIQLPFEPFSIAQRYVAFGGPGFPATGGEFHGVYVTPDTWQTGVGAFTTAEDPNRTQDVDQNGNNVDSPIEIRTALVIDDALHKTEIIEAQLEYEATIGQTLLFEYSSDGGNSWAAYSSATIAPTTRPRVVRVKKDLTTEGLQIRVRSTTTGGLTLNGLHLFVKKGPPIAP